MPNVTLRFSPLPEHVRTARLVAVSVARRAGFGEDQLDEIRIAIGEACSRAVAGGASGPTPVGMVDMELRDDQDRLDVTVVQCDERGEPLPDTGSTVPEPDPLSLALMAGMSDLSGRAPTASGVTLSWKRLTPETGHRSTH